MKRSFSKIKNNNSLIRDSYSGAVLSTDIQELKNYKELRNSRILKQKEQNKILERQDKIEADISEIKNLLKQFLENKI